jgi:hypothetical protein
MKSYWNRFLKWLDGKDAAESPEKIRLSFPKGNTDILLNCNQRKRLEDAMNGNGESETSSFYSRETGFWNKGVAAGGKKDDLII